MSSLDPPGPIGCLTPGESSGMYLDGRVFYLRGRTLVSRAFDAAAGRISGEAVPAVERVWREPGVYGRDGCTSANHAVACRHGGPSRLMWVERTGGRVPIRGPDDAVNPVVAPDGRRLAVTAGVPETMRDGLWVLDGTTAWMLTRRDFNVEGHAWSPDGQRIVFGAQGAATWGVYLQAVERGSGEHLLFNSPQMQIPTDWSSDGEWILFNRGDDLWRIRSRGGDPAPVMRSAAVEANGRFSPDVQWIAYQSNESGRTEVYVMPFGRPGDPIAVSVAGATQPQWRADGRALFFRALDGSVVSVPTDTRREVPIAGSPQVVLPAGTVDLLEYEWMYSATANGDKFAVLTPPDRVLSNRITLLVDWRPHGQR
jgi:dipeptidyl aminopeptidase/acylaminoacyl peptidase